MRKLLLFLVLSVWLIPVYSQECIPVIDCNASSCYPAYARIWINEPVVNAYAAYSPGFDEETLTVGRNTSIYVSEHVGYPAEALRKVVSSKSIELLYGQFIPAKETDIYPCNENFLEFVIGKCFQSGSRTTKRRCQARIAELEALPLTQATVFPNPSNTGIFNVTILDSTQRIEVYNSFGQLVPEIKLSNGSFDLTTQPNGIYTLKIIGKNKIETSFIVLSK